MLRHNANTIRDPNFHGKNCTPNLKSVLGMKIRKKIFIWDNFLMQKRIPRPSFFQFSKIWKNTATKYRKQEFGIRKPKKSSQHSNITSDRSVTMEFWMPKPGRF